MLQIIIATFYHRKKSQIVPSLGCSYKALTHNLTHLEPHRKKIEFATPVKTRDSKVFYFPNEIPKI